jgi:acetyl-CoA carboxylase biotin carboxyl carrier protein
VSLTAKDIEEITRLLEDSSFDELELEIGGMKLHLRRSGDIPRSGAGERFSRLAEQPLARASKTTTASPANPSPAPLTDVAAPLLGTFYRAARPGAPPFVEVGARVEPDSIVGIIEVMKLMNTVRAGVAGVVREICARDGMLVEYGETLLRIDTRDAG